MICKKLFILINFISFLTVAGHAQTDEFHLNETYQIDANGTLLLKSDDAQVTITGSDREGVHVVIDYKLDIDGINIRDYEPFEMKVWREGGNLYIEEQPRERDGFVVGNTDETYTITIEAPQEVSLKLKGDDENYKISDINGKINVDADDSDINCSSCGGNSFAYRLDDGTVWMNSGRGTLKLDVDDGNAHIKNSSFKTIKGRMDDGTFTIQNHAVAEGNYHFRLDDGTVELNMAAEAERPGPVKVSFRTDDGNISIRAHLNAGDEYRFDTDDADVTFSTLSGGATFYIRHDDANISSASGYQILINREGMSKYRLNNGGATIKIDVDDAEIALQ